MHISLARPESSMLPQQELFQSPRRPSISRLLRLVAVPRAPHICGCTLELLASLVHTEAATLTPRVPSLHPKSVQLLDLAEGAGSPANVCPLQRAEALQPLLLHVPQQVHEDSGHACCVCDMMLLQNAVNALAIQLGSRQHQLCACQGRSKHQAPAASSSTQSQGWCCMAHCQAAMVVGPSSSVGLAALSCPGVRQGCMPPQVSDIDCQCTKVSRLQLTCWHGTSVQ